MRVVVLAVGILAVSPGAWLGLSRAATFVPQTEYASPHNGTSSLEVATNTTRGSLTALIRHPYQVGHIPNSASIDCFAAERVKLNIELFGIADESVDLVGQLYQITTSLAAPIGDPVTILRAQPADGSTHLRLLVSVNLPSVQWQSQFVWQLWARSTGASAWQPVARQHFDVYPDDIFEELTYATRANLFVLDDDRGRLTSFLTQAHIRFTALSDLSLLETVKDTSRQAIDQKTGTSENRLLLFVIPFARESSREFEIDAQLSRLRQGGYDVIRFRDSLDHVPFVIVRAMPSGKSLTSPVR